MLIYHIALEHLDKTKIKKHFCTLYKYDFYLFICLPVYDVYICLRTRSQNKNKKIFRVFFSFSFVFWFCSFLLFSFSPFFFLFCFSLVFFLTFLLFSRLFLGLSFLFFFWLFTPRHQRRAPLRCRRSCSRPPGKRPANHRWSPPRPSATPGCGSSSYTLLRSRSTGRLHHPA